MMLLVTHPELPSTVGVSLVHRLPLKNQQQQQQQARSESLFVALGLLWCVLLWVRFLSVKPAALAVLRHPAVLDVQWVAYLDVTLVSLLEVK